MKRWFLEKNLTENQKKAAFKKQEPTEYDDIVDRSSFVQDKETIRNARLNAGSTSAERGVYDKTEPSDLEIAIRQGKLDKADITQEQYKLQKEIKDKDTKAKKEKEEALRQAAIDKAIGLGDQAKPEE